MIYYSEYAGVAKRLSKQIASDEERWEWEKDNVGIIKKALRSKSTAMPAVS